MACLIAGVAGYYYFSETATVLRVLMVLGGLVARGGRGLAVRAGQGILRVRAGSVGGSGTRGVADAQGNACRRPAIVFAFVVVMALFLFAVDTTLAWIIKLLTGRTDG